MRGKQNNAMLQTFCWQMEVMQRRPRVQDLLGALSPGVRQLEGKTFYLDAVRSRSSALLAESIARLGGVWNQMGGTSM